MSWSICIIGTPEKVAVEIFNQGHKFEGQSKIEYNDAAPHVAALVQQNFASIMEPGYVVPIVKIQASGSGYARDGDQINRSISVSIDNYYGTLAV